jgi:hypothetical protein
MAAGALLAGRGGSFDLANDLDGELRYAGAVTAEEFEAKNAELLARI